MCKLFDIEGHTNGLGLGDAKSNFMSMYEARLKGPTKPVQEIGKKQKAFATISTAVGKLKSKTSKVVVAPVVSSEVIPITEDDSVLTKKKSTRKSSPPSTTVKKEPEITPPTTKGRPRSNSSPKSKAIIDDLELNAQGTPDVKARVKKIEESRGDTNFDIITPKQQTTIQLITIRDGRSTITANDLKALNKIFPNQFNITSRVGDVKRFLNTKP